MVRAPAPGAMETPPSASRALRCTQSNPQKQPINSPPPGFRGRCRAATEGVFKTNPSHFPNKILFAYPTLDPSIRELIIHTTQNALIGSLSTDPSTANG